jgi:SAM-dependent methyltransferase
MSRDDVRKNLASWEADSVAYQARNAAQLDRWDRLAWGIWDVPEDDIQALGDVEGLRALELGCGAAQFGLRTAARGADVIGLDFSATQLGFARANVQARDARFPLVCGNAEELPFADASFDLVFCDHGATSFTDPHVAIPEVARVLRTGGRFVFNIATPFVSACWPDEDAPAGWELKRSYFEGGRHEVPDGDLISVEWRLGYGEWIRLFVRAGFIVEDLIELRPEPDAETTYEDYAPLEWARDFPGEHIWKVRKG